MSLNSILLRRKNSVYCPKSSPVQKTNINFVSSVNKNFEGLGYTLSKKVLERLTYLNCDELVEFYNNTLKVLKELKGVKNYKPFYPNFPSQVMEASDGELYWNAMLHYLSFNIVDVTGNKDLIWIPKYDKVDRPELNEKITLKVINLIDNEEEIHKIFNNLMASSTSISKTDEDDIKWYIKNYSNPSIPSQIPHKEVMALVGSELIAKKSGIEKMAGCFKTATDVLRLAVAMSGGDISLAATTKFRHFKRHERRSLLTLLDRTGNTLEDMFRHRMKWIRLGEILHPGEFKQLYNARSAFKDIRDDNKGQTFNSKIEKYIKDFNGDDAIPLLKQRPGEFARRLNHLSRRFGSEIVSDFAEVADRVSTPVLLQVLSHFKNNVETTKTVFPKGNIAKIQTIKNKVLPSTQRNKIVNLCEEVLTERFSQKESLGKVYIDEALKEFIVPFSQRSASESALNLTRGSKIALPTDKNTVRFFIWWKESSQRTDLDLSACFYDKNWKNKGQVAYYSLRYANNSPSGYIACHSGDITSAPNGACEFIDIDISSCKNQGRYVVMTVNVYSGDKFCDLKECFAGWMMRSNPNSGEIFDARTVIDKFTVTSSGKFCIPLIIDMQERKVIWADASINNRGRKFQNALNSNDSISMVGKAISNIGKTDVYSLLKMHAKGRGKIVKNKKNADKIYDVEYVTKNLEQIMGEFL